MAVKFGRIDVAIGADRQVKRNVAGVPLANLLTKAWLTVKVKVADADPGVFQKTITTAAVADQGQITDDGNTDGIGQLVFNITAANSALLTEGVTYEYDIKGKQADGKLFPVERGIVIATKMVTQATS